MEDADGPIGGRAAQRNSLALLALLADARPGGLPRATLVAILWPERPSKNARQLLNTIVYQLRNALEPDALVSENGNLRLDPGLVASDLGDFEAAIRDERWEKAVDLFDGPFLDGFFGPDSVEFEKWVEGRREAYDRQHERALEALARRAEAAGDLDTAIRWWESIVRRRPDRATAVERLMMALESVGRRSRALEVAERHAAAMQEEFDARPDPGVEAIETRLRREPTRRPRSVVPPTTTNGEGAASGSNAASDVGGEPAPPWTGRLAALLPRTNHRIGSILAGAAVLVVIGSWIAGWNPLDGAAGEADGRPITTDSPTARDAYERGERLFRSGRFDAAAEQYRRAVVEDSTFALAYYRLSQASLWADRPMTFLFDVDERAMRHRMSLPRRERLLVEAYADWRAGKADGAEDRYRSFLSEFPDDPEGWFMLGETLFHYNPLRGRSVAESRQPFERAAGLDPGHWGARWHLALLAAAEPDRAREARRRLGALLATAPSPANSLEIRALTASTGSGSIATSDLEPELRGAGALQLFDLLTRAAVLSDDRAGARSLGRLLAGKEGEAFPRITGHQALLALDLADGRLREADRRAATIVEVDPDRRWIAHDLVVYRALLPLAPRSPERIASTREALLEAKPDLAVPSAAVRRGPAERATTYLLGLLDAALGDPAALERARALESAGAPGYGAAVRAEVAAREGRLVEALAHLELSRRPVWFGWALSSPVQAQAYERFARAEVLRELGRPEEALRWYASFDDHSIFDLIYEAPSHLRRGQVHASLGNVEEAKRHYARFLELWAEADPELRPRVESARRELERLASP